MPTLPAGKTCRVRFGNSHDERYLLLWDGREITSYTAGDIVFGGNFDIANISLVSPGEGATVKIPVTFDWDARGISGDEHIWLMKDPDAPYVLASSGSLGTSTEYTLEGPPAGLEYGREYIWYIEVLNGDNGYGLSLYRSIYFAALVTPTSTPTTSPTPTPCATTVSGTIVGNTTWHSGCTYIVTGDILIRDTLTIQDGVTVVFDGYYELRVDGDLKARGKEDSKITFTSSRPTKGSWVGIEFAGNYLDPSSESFIERSIIEFADIGIETWYDSPDIGYNTLRDNRVALNINWPRSSMSIARNLIEGNGTQEEERHYAAVYLYPLPPRYASSPLKLWYNSIVNNLSGIYIGEVVDYTLPDILHIVNNNLHSNTYWNVYVGSGPSGEEIDATNNWWGTVDTSVIDEDIFDFNDDIDLAKVIYRPFATGPIPGAPTPTEATRTYDQMTNNGVGASGIIRLGSPARWIVPAPEGRSTKPWLP